MQPNTRDTPSRRISTVVWGTALMLSVGIVGVVLYPLFNPTGKELDDHEQAHAKLPQQFKEIRETQAKAKAELNYNQDVAAKALLESVSK